MSMFNYRGQWVPLERPEKLFPGRAGGPLDYEVPTFLHGRPATPEELLAYYQACRRHFRPPGPRGERELKEIGL